MTPPVARLEQALLGADPARPALVAGERSLCYRELRERAEACARALRAAGTQPGDRIAFLVEAPLDLVPALLGVWRLGAVACVLNPGTGPRKLERILAIARPARLLRDRDPLLAGSAGAALPDPPAEAELACLVFTSGTTGVPRGVELTHANLIAAGTAIHAYLRHGPADVVQSALPLAFSYGLAQLVTCLLAGATLVVERSFTYPREFLARAAKRRATGIPLVPTMAALLLRTDRSGLDLGALRYFTTAGAGLPVALGTKLRDRFPQVELYVMYGQTECVRASYLPPAEYARRPDSVGRGMPGVELWLADAAGRRLAPPARGELIVAGANVMRGYFGDPAASAAKLIRLDAGRRALRTGDEFTVDGDGWLRFVARQDEIIKCRGEKVPPREVEEALLELAGVREAAVTGVPDPVLGQAVKAVVVREPGAALDALAVQRHCAARLEEFMVPKQVEFRDSLPRNESGKILRDQL
jgi:acyl-CoA synthetase (AMP-forming)/AMP-acid ligase II